MRWLALSVGLLSAPVQCGEPETIRYADRDDPAQVLYMLSQRFEEQGEHRAALETWRYLVERYPASRYAERARIRLDEALASPVQRAEQSEQTP